MHAINGPQNGPQDHQHWRYRHTMARHKLNDAFCKTVTESKDHHDGGGLVLRVNSGGSKQWVYRYQINKRRTSMGLGSFPAISLRQARQARNDAETLVKQKIDPRRERSQRLRRGAKLKDVVDEFFTTKKDILKRDKQWLSPFQHVLPKLGDRPVDSISVDDLIRTFEPIWKTKHPTAARALNRLEQVLVYAAGQGDWDIDITIVPKAKARLGRVKHTAKGHQALPWKELPDLWSSLDKTVTNTALKFYILTVVRVANVTYAEWEEFDNNLSVWSIPAERMKASKPFRVPLVWQARALLGKRGTGLVFPSYSARIRGVVSENTWNKHFRSNGWKTTAHGLRSTFRDWCAETSVCDDALAEFCIQHETAKGNKVARAYYRSDMLDARREVMSKWAGFVTGKEKAALDEKAKRDQSVAALDLPVEAGRHGRARTRREVEEWARNDVFDDT